MAVVLLGHGDEMFVDAPSPVWGAGLGGCAPVDVAVPLCVALLLPAPSQLSQAVPPASLRS